GNASAQSILGTKPNAKAPRWFVDRELSATLLAEAGASDPWRNPAFPRPFHRSESFRARSTRRRRIAARRPRPRQLVARARSLSSRRRSSVAGAKLDAARTGRQHGERRR